LNLSTGNQRGELINIVADLVPKNNAKEACAAFGISRATYYR